MHELLAQTTAPSIPDIPAGWTAFITQMVLLVGAISGLVALWRKQVKTEAKAETAGQKAQAVAQNVDVLNQVVDQKSPVSMVPPDMAARTTRLGTGNGKDPPVDQWAGSE